MNRDQGPALQHAVSIIIPAYNCAATIGTAVESCLKQTFRGAEIIVVNDGSTDATAAVLQGFGAGIKVIHQCNGGLAAARNTGMRAATGDFIAWMDADDVAEPERIRLQVQALASQPEIALVSSDFSAFTDLNGDVEWSHIATYYDAVRRLGGVQTIYPHVRTPELAAQGGGPTPVVRWGEVYEKLLWGNFVHPPTVMIRRRVIDEVGLFDETLRYSSDYDLIIRIARAASFAFVDAPLLRYRRGPAQMSHAGAGGKMQLETVRILEKVRSDDPALWTRCADLFRLRLAESLMSAAESVATVDRAQAFVLLRDGLKLKVLPRPALRALVRVLTPRAVWGLAKRVWHAIGRKRFAAVLLLLDCFGPEYSSSLLPSLL